MMPGVSTPDPARTEPIIRAVWSVIDQRGIGAVSMRTVAAAAGVSVGRIQYWFASKEELLHASLAAMLSGAVGNYQDAAGDDRQALWQLVSHAIPQAQASGVGVAVFHQYVAASINDPVLAEMLAGAKDGAETEVVRLLRRIAPELPGHRTAARRLIATADGLAMRVLVGGLTVRQAERALRVEMDRLLD